MPRPLQRLQSIQSPTVCKQLCSWVFNPDHVFPPPVFSRGKIFEPKFTLAFLAVPVSFPLGTLCCLRQMLFLFMSWWGVCQNLLFIWTGRLFEFKLLIHSMCYISYHLYYISCKGLSEILTWTSKGNKKMLHLVLWVTSDWSSVNLVEIWKYWTSKAVAIKFDSVKKKTLFVPGEQLKENLRNKWCSLWVHGGFNTIFWILVLLWWFFFNAKSLYISMYWFDYEKIVNIVALEMAFRPSVSGIR